MLKVFLLFASYPVVTVLDVRHERQLAFPAVTLCNLNVLRLSQYHDSALFQSLQADLSVSGEG